jgi:hypothetical protein
MKLSKPIMTSFSIRQNVPVMGQRGRYLRIGQLTGANISKICSSSGLQLPVRYSVISWAKIYLTGVTRSVGSGSI